MTGEVFDVKRFAIHDGPGIRCTAFLKGCPLNCAWCHNPEGKRPGFEIGYFPYQCIGCGACIDVCQNGAISYDAGGIVIDRVKCMRCGKCGSVCPSKAIVTKGAEMTADALMEKFTKDEVFFQTSGGGITMSGGDPLYQPEFTVKVLRMAKEKGYHTAVDTCLYAPDDIIHMLMDLTDLWIVDLKIWDDNVHKEMTGQTNRLIFANYEKLAESGRVLLTRIPVIPGYTDARENLTALGRYIAKVNPGGKVELMFYNPLAESKYKNFNIQYTLFGTGQYTEKQQEEFRKIIAVTGACVI